MRAASKKKRPALFGAESAHTANGFKIAGKRRIFEPVAFEWSG
jgi:hypothetical protein